MNTVNVDLGSRSYPIFIAQDLLSQAEYLLPYIKGKQVCLVSNETVAPLYLAKVKSLLADFHYSQVILPDGEAYKNFDCWQQILETLLAEKHNRSTTIIALGGGVIGDISGFAAAAYQRGVDFIQLPTTLLSQVDSSVGGKTAINHPLGKNMIGAFHQPNCVVADMSTLATLPARELAAGIAEVIKYGLICDADFFVWLEANIEALNCLDPDAIAYAVQRSCENKARVVSADEHEKGMRAILNLGHTFGHAIEASQGYGVWLHGEAVSVGMVMAVDLSCRMGWLNSDILVRTKTILRQAKLPIAGPADMTADEFLEYMGMDKKVVDGELRLVLLSGLGEAVVTAEAELELIKTVIVDNLVAQ